MLFFCVVCAHENNTTPHHAHITHLSVQTMTKSGRWGWGV